MANQAPPDPTFAGSLIDNSQSEVWSDYWILGCRLRKFSLWTRLLLSTAQSPFLTKGSVTLTDLRIAVGCCRNRFGDSRIRKPWLVPCLIWMWVVLTALWPRRRRKGDLEDRPVPNTLQRALSKRAEAFLQYCGDYLQEPKWAVVPPETNGSRTRIPRGRAPEELDHVADLIGWGIPERRAWEMPMGLANWYRVMALKSLGADIDFIDPEEQKFQMGLPPGYRWRNN